jgi:hypothetical protein
MIDPQHEQRLRRLLVSWSIRAQPGATGQQATLLRENIEAVSGALQAAERSEALADNVSSALAEIRLLRRDIERMARVGKTVGRHELSGMASRLDDVIRTLEK